MTSERDGAPHPGPAGDAERGDLAEAVAAGLAGLEGLSVHDHVDVYERLHRQLAEALDGTAVRPGGAVTHPGPPGGVPRRGR